MFEREAKTVYFRHFPKHGLRSVFATEDARIAAAILGKMIVQDAYWDTVQKMLAEYGLKAADVPHDAVPSELPSELVKPSRSQPSLI